MKSRIVLWIDNFSKGGLEKSSLYLANELIKNKSNSLIEIHTLLSSKNAIQLALEKSNLMNIPVISHKSRMEAIILLIRILNRGTTVISLKNHIPLVLSARILCVHQNLWVRHSNSILAQIISSNHPLLNGKQPLLWKFLAWLDLVFRVSVYRLCMNHLANSFENAMLVESVAGVRCYCFYTIPCIHENHSGSTSDVPSVVWRGRYCNSKGIPILLNYLQQYSPVSNLQSFRHSQWSLTIYTNEPKNIHRKIQAIDARILNNITIANWTDANKSQASYSILLLTSLHEGMSNVFLEAICNNMSVVVPLTSSGFIEFLYSLPGIYFYSLNSIESLHKALSKAFQFVSCNNSRDNRALFSVLESMRSSNLEFISSLP